MIWFLRKLPRSRNVFNVDVSVISGISCASTKFSNMIPFWIQVYGLTKYWLIRELGIISVQKLCKCCQPSSYKSHILFVQGKCIGAVAKFTSLTIRNTIDIQLLVRHCIIFCTATLFQQLITNHIFVYLLA